VFLYANIHNLRTGTELTDMFGRDDPQWRAASQIGKELGYGQSAFCAGPGPSGRCRHQRSDGSGGPTGSPPRWPPADSSSRLAADFQEEELLNLVRLFSWHFPSYAFARPEQSAADRWSRSRFIKNVRRAATNWSRRFPPWARITLSPIRWA